jgi:RNA polymerase sigma-70 factor, ECF subfamily
VLVMDANLTANLPLIGMEPDTAYVTELIGFDELYFREYPALYALATALAGSADSEDLVHDTMVKALINWERVQRLERPGGWCHRVLINCCRGWWRLRQREARFVSRFRPSDTYVDGPSADVVAFWAAVRQLPSRPRMVVALYYAADRTTVEVASILGVPEGTVRSDLTRARVVLAAELGN